MEPQGESHAHKLPGTRGCSPGNKVFCPTEQTSQGAMAMVHGEEHPPQGPAPGRCTEHHSRRRIEVHEGPVRLDAVPESVSQDQLEAGTSGGGPVCEQADTPAPDICQLETRSNGEINRCIHDGLGQPQSVRQPSMEPDRQGPGPDAPPAGGSNPSGPSLEGTGLVPSTAGDAGGHSTPDPSGQGPDHSHASREPPRGGPPISRVGYRRQHCKDNLFSEGAAKLLLASWRQKSSKTYDSLFEKWACWCSERDSDPISCPIGEVVNFLAHLFEQGYQYRSIKSYRSAISSVHEKVDGYEVGQHSMVSQIIKGIYHERPTQPRYSETWSVATVTA